MNIATILAEIESEAARRNNETIARALKYRDVGKCCNFRNNISKFLELLDRYKRRRTYMSHLRKEIRGDWFSSSPPSTWRNDLRTRDAWLRQRHDSMWSRAEMMYARISMEADEIRRELAALWPCKVCMIFFNPTNRSSRRILNV
jgi:hypothetical protein